MVSGRAQFLRPACWERQVNWAEPSHIKEHHILAWLEWLRERGLSEASRNSYFRALRAWFNWLGDEEYIAKSPMHRIKASKLPKLLPETYTQEDVTKLLDACPPRPMVGRA